MAIDDIDIWEKCDACCPKPVRPLQRIVHFNRIASAVGADRKIEDYPKNVVVTSRYTWWNFVFKNLIEQFMRIANVYFLVCCIIQLTNPDSPTFWVSSVAPLVFVLLVTAIKEGIEDIRRHEADEKVNHLSIELIRHGAVKKVRSEELQVGDIIRVTKNSPFPCDLLLLSTSSSGGECSVTTAGLDGETNLKIFKAVSCTNTLTNAESLSNLRGIIECEQPTAHLYKFSGRVLLDSPLLPRQNEPAAENPPENLSKIIAVQPLYNFTQSTPPPLSEENRKTEIGKQFSGELVSIDERNLLLRGAVLRNTEEIYGCVVYTGSETKLAINSRGRRVKISRVEKRMNFFLLIMLGLLLLVTSISTGLVYLYRNDAALYGAWYLQSTLRTMTSLQGFIEWLNYFLLYSYLIPISLYVTIELQKIFGLIFFGNDELLYDDRRKLRAKANTSDLNEELGQVEYLFTDKTGTLTENEMVFRKCFAYGEVYSEPGGNYERKLEEFFTAVVLCHTCRVEKADQSQITVATAEAQPDGAGYEFNASSPDERALLIAARQFGVVYHGMFDGNTMLVSYKKPTGNSHGEWAFKKYRLLHVLEFDSTRKCMSVIVQTEADEYWLVTKGAESSLLERAARGNEKQTRDVMSCVCDFGTQGLRTLVLGKAVISAGDYASLDKQLRQAQLAVLDREEQTQKAYRAVERNLELIGATGIEDRLQDGVSETVSNLRKAGIVIWVLTGDKEETAVNIAFSCALFTDKMRLVRVVQLSDSGDAERRLLELIEQIEIEVRANGTEPGATSIQYALVIDGASLAVILHEDAKTSEGERLKNLLLDLCLKSTSVLCCRVTPLQKAEIVKLVKFGVPDSVTCAIGDGANDVSMIQEAHLGLGIFGLEGRQAALTSDYCFSRFRHLNRVLFLHGHFYYNRIAVLVLYFFYKNCVFTLNQFFYQYLAAFSQVSIYDIVSLSVFNVTYATLPILVYGVFEQHISRDLLLEKPELYRIVRQNATLSYGNFARWVLLGVYQSAVVAFGSYVYFQSATESTLPDGQPLDSDTYGAFTLLSVILIVNIRLMIETRHWSLAEFLAFAITIVLGFFGVLLVFQSVVWRSVSLLYTYFVFAKALSYPVDWLICFAIILVSLLPDLILKAVSDMHSSQGLLQLEKMTHNSPKPKLKQESRSPVLPQSNVSTDTQTTPNC